MKLRRLITILFTSCLLGLASCSFENMLIATDISFAKPSERVSVGKTLQLTPKIEPTGANPKSLTWSSENEDIATVDEQGLVSGIANGTVNIVATTKGGKSASCKIFVDLPKATSISLDKSEATLAINQTLQLHATILPDEASGLGVIWKSSSSTSVKVSEDGLVTPILANKTITITAAVKGQETIKATCVISTVTAPVVPTAVTVTPATAELTAGRSKQLAVTYSPAGANTNLGVNWTTSNANIATVTDTGYVTINNDAPANSKVTITATSKYYSSMKSTCNITITEVQKASWTVMLYLCGNDLESKSSLATGDIKEILQVSNQPDDVNIIIETGGAAVNNTYFSTSNLRRYHVENKKMVLDESIPYANMGASSTFQSFMEWGLTVYPAEKTGVILWNHGGAMQGVCYDENRGDDNLVNSEVKTALTNAFKTTGQTEKLEWIGYDACLMAVQDIAEFNSEFFNYMVSSQETESGYGWDYDQWVDDLYAKKPTETILKAIVDSFIKENGGTSSSSNDQTLSVLNLNNMANYKTAFENFADAIKSKIASAGGSNWRSFLKRNVKYYADSSYVGYSVMDVKDMINKVSSNSTYNPGSTYTNAVLNAFSQLVIYSSCGKGAGNSNGLCFYFALGSSAYKSYFYTSSETNFSNWRLLVTSYGG